MEKPQITINCPRPRASCPLCCNGSKSCSTCKVSLQKKAHYGFANEHVIDSERPGRRGCGQIGQKLNLMALTRLLGVGDMLNTIPRRSSPLSNTVVETCALGLFLCLKYRKPSLDWGANGVGHVLDDLDENLLPSARELKMGSWCLFQYYNDPYGEGNKGLAQDISLDFTLIAPVKLWPNANSKP